MKVSQMRASIDAPKKKNKPLLDAIGSEPAERFECLDI